MPRFLVDPSKAWQAWKEASHAAEAAAFVVASGDPDLVASADAVLGGGTPLRRSSVPVDQLANLKLGPAEILLVLIQPSEEDRILPGLRTAGLPLGGVVAVDEGPVASHDITRYENDLLRVSFSTDEPGWEAVREAVCDLGDDHLVALGRRHPGLRRACAHRMITKTARQNGVIAVAFFVPGTDMPLMTLNQIKLVLGLAAMHGLELNQERVFELLAVLGVGFTFRTIARQVVDLIPGPGVAWKAGIGYSGTLALGRAALRYFEEGAPATPGPYRSVGETPPAMSPSGREALAGGTVPPEPATPADQRTSATPPDRYSLLRARFEEVLERIQNPARLIGGETGAAPGFGEDPDELRVALAFPDTYEIGISNQALQILYHLARREPGVGVERVYLPWVDAIQELRQAGIPLLTLETWTPLRDAHLLGISLQHELSYTNVLELLDLAGIALRASDRGEDEPLVIAGGPATANFLPVAPFVDAVVVGEAEEAFPEVLREARAARSAGLDRAGRKERLATLEGVFVPGVSRTVSRRVLSRLEGAPYPAGCLVPLTSAVHDRAWVEVMRGCCRGCRFCQAGMWYRPVRERTAGAVLAEAEAQVAATGYQEVSPGLPVDHRLQRSGADVDRSGRTPSGAAHRSALAAGGLGRHPSGPSDLAHQSLPDPGSRGGQSAHARRGQQERDRGGDPRRRRARPSSWATPPSSSTS